MWWRVLVLGLNSGSLHCCSGWYDSRLAVQLRQSHRDHVQRTRAAMSAGEQIAVLAAESQQLAGAMTALQRDSTTCRDGRIPLRHSAAVDSAASVDRSGSRSCLSPSETEPHSPTRLLQAAEFPWQGYGHAHCGNASWISRCFNVWSRGARGEVDGHSAARHPPITVRETADIDELHYISVRPLRRLILGHHVRGTLGRQHVEHEVF